mmetsp:Transcript_6310/g.16099  ORF Transcript_6310/g.16099 Transcript_6310/m.16099 type:complete len:333 (+) Transcript_6310:130-1128(+)
MGPFRTRLTELLGIEHPVVCGGMTGTGGVELAAAVSNAGGLGMLTALNSGTAEQLKKDIARLRTLTDKPFGVNLTILPAMVPPDYESFAKAIIDSGVKVVETAGSNPKKWVAMFKAAGCISIHKCVTIQHALSAQRMGVDVLSIDAFECAGHPGEADVGGMVLFSRAAQEIKSIWIASGGIAVGRQLTACLALGASGVNMGTAFCATKECPWPESFKQKVVDSKETDTVLMFRQLHNTARVIRNKVSSEVEAIALEKGKDLDFSDVADLVKGDRGREAERNGDPDGGIWTAGQCIGLIHDIPTVQQFMDRFIGEAEASTKHVLAGVLSNSRL